MIQVINQSAVIFVAFEFSPEVAVSVAGHEAALVAVVSPDNIPEPQAFPDIAVPFPVSAPASALGVADDTARRPTFAVFASVDYCATSASSVEAVGDQSVHGTSCVRTRCGLCNMFSS